MTLYMYDGKLMLTYGRTGLGLSVQTPEYHCSYLVTGLEDAKKVDGGSQTVTVTASGTESFWSGNHIPMNTPLVTTPVTGADSWIIEPDGSPYMDMPSKTEGNVVWGQFLKTHRQPDGSLYNDGYEWKPVGQQWVYVASDFSITVQWSYPQNAYQVGGWTVKLGQHDKTMYSYSNTGDQYSWAGTYTFVDGTEVTLS